MFLSSLPLQTHHTSRVVWEHFAPLKIKGQHLMGYSVKHQQLSLLCRFWGERDVAIDSCGPAAGSGSDGVVWAMLCEIQVSLYRSWPRPKGFF